MGVFAVGEKNKMLDAWAARADYTQNADVYAKLHLGDPGAAGTSNPAAETTRALVTFGAGASSGAISNTADVEWINVSTSETVSWVSFWSAITGGTYLGKDDLPASKALNSGDTFRIPTGDLDVTLPDS